MHLMPRVAAVLVLASCAAMAMQCDRIYIGAKHMRRDADLVFQGTIVGFEGPNGNDFTVFDVSRVWRGSVPKSLRLASLEAPGPSLLTTRWSIGAQLLVFASRGTRLKVGPPDIFFPISCGVLRIADALDIKSLGKGREPR